MTLVLFENTTGNIVQSIPLPLGVKTLDVQKMFERHPNWVGAVDFVWLSEFPFTTAKAQRQYKIDLNTMHPITQPKTTPVLNPSMVELQGVQQNAIVQSLLTMTPAEVDTWVNQNTATIAQVRVLLRFLVRFVLWYLRKQK